MSFAQFNKKDIPEYGAANFPGLDEAVLKNQKLLGNNLVVMVWTDTLIYKRELGEFDAKTVAPIASCSKWLTAAMIMKFVEEGKIALDDKVGKYIPVFDNYGKSYITIRNCLSHMTGIQADPVTLMKLLQRKKYRSLEEEVNDFAKKEIQANAGTEFRYSNIGLNIAARILEIVSKKRYNGQQILSAESVKQLRTIQTKPEQIKYAPKIAEGFNYALGSWVLEEGKDGEATVLACPGLFGTWPMVDWRRRYACLIFVKTLLSEQKKDAYMEIKDAIDKQRPYW